MDQKQKDISYGKIYSAVTSAKVSESEEYCTALCHNSNNETAVLLSNNYVNVLTTDTLQSVTDFEAHSKTVTGIRFSPTDDNVLWTSSLDGSIRAWDMRSGKCEKNLETFSQAENGGCLKPLNAFDISRNERIVCAGTEQIQGESFLLFWDIRSTEALGGYTESHSNDITQVQFHPVQPDTMASSSTDGLINVFDLSQKDEDDALMYSLHNDVAVDKLMWLKTNGKYERLGAITDVFTLQYWDMREAAPMHSFSRKDLKESIKCEVTSEIYPISIHALENNDNPLILVGSGMDENDCVRTVKLDLSTGQLQLEGSLVSKQTQRLTRAAMYEEKTDTFITAGECGTVRLWKPEDTSMINKEVVKSKSHRKKPY